MAPNSTIRQRVSLIAAGVSAAVVGAVLLIMILTALRNSLNQSIEQSTSMAMVLGSNLTAAIAFEDEGAAADILSALESTPNVLRGAVYIRGGRLLAQYQSARPEPKQTVVAPSAVSSGSGSQAYVRQIDQPISLGGDEIGSISLWLDTWPTYRSALNVFWLGVAIWLLGTVVAYLLARTLNQSVVRPLQSLSRLMNEVSTSEDYSKRFSYADKSEVGMLGASFNRMLGQIEDREQRLRYVISELEVARDKAEGAARSKSTFLANMSHEIRTPMNGVVGMISLLKNTPMTEQQRLYFDTIEQSAASLLVIIDDILDFTKIEVGRLEIQSEPFSLREMLAFVVRFFQEPTQKKGLEFVATIAEDIPWRVVGDSGRIRQVLLNLLGNAVKFTDHGKIEFSVEPYTKDGVPWIRFSVTDTGIGIAEEKQTQIFAEFFQADQSSTRQYGGTGLGLAISRQLATLMGGDVSFSSTLGEGSCFWFEMPLNAELANPFTRPNDTGPDQSNPFVAHAQAQNTVSALETPNDNDPSIVDAEAATGSQLRLDASVLVADDSEVNRFIIRELLGTFGLSPDLVANGEEAVTAFRKKDYDLVFMDIQMPVMDGVTATAKIREAQQSEGLNPESRVIGLSAHAMGGDRERYMASGMDDYLTKPVEVEQLASVLKRQLHAPFTEDPFLWR